jgi:hypothetical protein
MYDIYGNSVLVQIQQTQQASRLIIVDGSKLNPGIYFCRVQTADWTEIRKVILSR